jgi:hypothetical protein
VKATRSLSRRSFLSRVGGASFLALGGCATPRAETSTYDPLEDAAPDQRAGLPTSGCTDGDSAPGQVDRPGHGRTCNNGRGRGRDRPRRPSQGDQ